MFAVTCYCNPLTALPTLPLELEDLSCHSCTLTSLPVLPSNLRKLNCLGNPLETLPELPSTLEEVQADLPIHYEFNEEIQEEIQHGGRMIYAGMYPDLVGSVNYMIVRAAVYANQESKKRCVERCAQYKHEIMMTVWHPKRVEKLIEMGIDLEDVM
jgi:Leucine-rich repeat (LRR) protein